MLSTKLVLIALAVAAGLTAALPTSADYINPDYEFIEALPQPAKETDSCDGRDKAKKGDKIWCMCNAGKKKITKKEDCENPGGGRADVCAFDDGKKECTPEAGPVGQLVQEPGAQPIPAGMAKPVELSQLLGSRPVKDIATGPALAGRPEQELVAVEGKPHKKNGGMKKKANPLAKHSRKPSSEQMDINKKNPLNQEFKEYMKKKAGAKQKKALAKLEKKALAANERAKKNYVKSEHFVKDQDIYWDQDRNEWDQDRDESGHWVGARTRRAQERRAKRNSKPLIIHQQPGGYHDQLINHINAQSKKMKDRLAKKHKARAKKHKANRQWMNHINAQSKKVKDRMAKKQKANRQCAEQCNVKFDASGFDYNDFPPGYDDDHDHPCVAECDALLNAQGGWQGNVRWAKHSDPTKGPTRRTACCACQWSSKSKIWKLVKSPMKGAICK